MGHDHEHNRVFHGLTPAELWHHFGHITEIARPSGKEERMAEYVKAEDYDRMLAGGLGTEATTVEEQAFDVF